MWQKLFNSSVKAFGFFIFGRVKENVSGKIIMHRSTSTLLTFLYSSRATWGIGIIMSLLVILAVVIEVSPVFEPLEFDTDEGVELGRAWALNEGYILYETIWSDHPPLYAYLMSGVLQFFGTQNIAAARCVSLFFLAMLLVANFWLLRQYFHSPLSVLGTLLLVSAPKFFSMTLPLYIGAASLAVFMWSLVLFIQAMKLRVARFHARPINVSGKLPLPNKELMLLIGSGLLLGIALTIKLMPIYLTPLFAVLYTSYMWPHMAKISRQWIVKDILLLFVPFALFFISIGVASGFFQSLDQVLFKLGGQSRDAFADFSHIKFIGKTGWIFFYLFLLCIPTWWMWKDVKQRRRFILPFTWGALTVLAFLIHRPLWSHYRIFMLLPLTWVAILGVEKLSDFWLDRFPQYHSKNRWLGLILMMGMMLYSHHSLMYWKKKRFRHKIVGELVQNHIPKGSLVFTDRPFYVLLNGSYILPEIAVFPMSRLKSGHITTEELVWLSQKKKPDYVLLGRFTPSELGADFQKELERGYTKVYEHNEKTQLWVRLSSYE